jgi:hypothetical protein
MKMKLAGATAAFALLAGIAHAADLTVSAGNVTEPYSGGAVYQIVEAGNPYSDTPRTASYDIGSTGGINLSGSALPISTSDFSLAYNFTTSSTDSFAAQLEDSLGGADSLDLYKGASLVATSSAANYGLQINSLNIGPGSYTLVVDGTVYSSADPEAEGTISFEGTAATISAAPEPTTWVLMFVGIGFAGGALRMRKREFNGLATA